MSFPPLSAGDSYFELVALIFLKATSSKYESPAHWTTGRKWINFPVEIDPLATIYYAYGLSNTS